MPISLQKLIKKFGQYKEVPSHSDEVRFCCPYCVNIGKPPDTKFHLYVNLTKGVGYCFRCGKVLRFSKDLKTIISFNGTKNTYTNIRKTLSFLKEIPKCREIYDTPAFEFLMAKLSGIYSIDFIKKFIEEYDLKLCVDKKYPYLYYRIMIPIKFNGKLVGFQFRSIFGEEPKYLSLGYQKENIKSYLFNYDRAKSEKIVYLVEGVFDILPIQDRAVAVFGKYLTENQINLVKLTWEFPVVVFDRDAISDAYKTVGELLRSGFERVGVIELNSEKDPCEMGFEFKKLPIKELSIIDIISLNL